MMTDVEFNAVWECVFNYADDCIKHAEYGDDQKQQREERGNLRRAKAALEKEMKRRIDDNNAKGKH